MSDMSSNLTDFVAQMGGERNLRVEENLGEGYVRLRVQEAERRQAQHDIRCIEDVVIEMLRNARDAAAKHIYVAMSKVDTTRTIVMIDDGCGVVPEMQEKIFEARVTSKLESIHMDRWGVHGRGMALYSISENVEDARVMSSDAGLGSAIRIISDTTKLDERKDQSSWPEIGEDEQGQKATIRGPHNIIRTCCDFALEERGACEVYVGSPAEIAATIRFRTTTDEHSDYLFLDSLDSLPITQRFHLAADASELTQLAESCGLEMSERTAHRILAHQIKPLRSVYSRLFHKAGDKNRATTDIDLTKDRRNLKLAHSDTDEFSRMLERDFDFLADRYYLRLQDTPRVRVSKNKIVVTFQIEEHD